jgi:hypothetical protein
MSASNISPFYKWEKVVNPETIYGNPFDNKQKSLKQSLNKEIKKYPIKNSVAIVWYSVCKGLFAHAALSIDDKLYGFALGSRTPESPSLKESCARRMGKSNKQVTVQYVPVNSYQRKKIEEICQWKSFPCTTCMHAIARILNIAKVINIPFPINFSPIASAEYLNAIHTIGGAAKVEVPYSIDSGGKGRIDKNVLSKQTTYGSIKPPIRREWAEFAVQILCSYIFPYAVLNIITMDAYPHLVNYISIGCVTLVALKHLTVIKTVEKAILSSQKKKVKT